MSKWPDFLFRVLFWRRRARVGSPTYGRSTPSAFFDVNSRSKSFRRARGRDAPAIICKRHNKSISPENRGMWRFRGCLAKSDYYDVYSSYNVLQNFQHNEMFLKRIVITKRRRREVRAAAPIGAARVEQIFPRAAQRSPATQTAPTQTQAPAQSSRLTFEVTSGVAHTQTLFVFDLKCA